MGKIDINRLKKLLGEEIEEGVVPEIIKSDDEDNLDEKTLNYKENELFPFLDSDSK